MPRNRGKSTQDGGNVVKSAAKEPEKPIPERDIPAKKVPAKKVPVLALYRQLYSLRSVLRVVNPKIAKTTDRILASIAYPARFLSFVLGIARLKELTNAIGDYRTFSRVVSTPATLKYALDLILDDQTSDPVIRATQIIQSISGLLFQVFEDIAYLASKRIISVSAKRQADFWVYSSVFWAIDVATELLKIPYEHYVLHEPVSVRKLAVNLAWLPLTYHWSTYQGVFNDGWVGAFGTAACWPNMVYQWKTA